MAYSNYIMTDSIKLTEYEKIVKKTVEDLLKPYNGRFSIDNSGASNSNWQTEITPTNPKAAKMYISDVGSGTIYMAVDDVYFLEFYPSDDEFKNGLPDFTSHCRAILSGKLTGYHVKHKRDFTKSPYMKTVLHFDMNGTIVPHSRNVIFRKRFIKRKDVIKQDFEGY